MVHFVDILLSARIFFHVCTWWQVDFQCRRSVWGTPSRSSGPLSHLWTKPQTEDWTQLLPKNVVFHFLCVLSHHYHMCIRMCVFALTFRIKVTPSSKRIPRSGDAELQRRKQSPSRRAGRIPAIWTKHTHETHTLDFSLRLNHCISATTIRVLVKEGVWAKCAWPDQTTEENNNDVNIPSERSSRSLGSWSYRLPSLCECYSTPETQEQLVKKTAWDRTREGKVRKSSLKTICCLINELQLSEIWRVTVE